MNHKYVLKTFAIFCAAMVIGYGGFSASHYLQDKKADTLDLKAIDDNSSIQRKVNFIKPDYNPIESKHLTRVEIDIRDDFMSPNGKVISVTFNDDQLTLRPADHYGKRGSTFLQLRPGNYTIVWSVKNNPYAWPREAKHSSQIKVLSSDLWIHVLIEGENITIS